MNATGNTAADVTACSCGCVKPHQIAGTRTADNKILALWSDGWLTWALGAAIRGAAQPRTAEQRAAALTAGRLVLGEASLYDASEVPGLIAAARVVVKRDPSAQPGDLRAELRRRAGPAMPAPAWDVQAGFRVWVFHRISRLAGLAIWHERGCYSVLRVARGMASDGQSRNALVPTGAHATSLRRAYALALELQP